MGRDILEKPYGRFYHLPRILAQKGHSVTMALLSYAPGGSIEVKRDGMLWTSDSVVTGGPRMYLKRLEALIRREKPDWIAGFSDTYYGILAEWLGRKHNTRSVIDAYDNYEGYIPWCRPLHYYWRKALSGASLVTVAGPPLERYVRRFREKGDIAIVPMSVDPIGFIPRDREESRGKLGLPRNKKLVGYCGSLQRNRGIVTMMEAIENLVANDPAVELVVTGRKGRGIRLPAACSYLGYVDDETLPLVMNSVDVLIVMNKLSQFGKFSHPVKLYEAMSCQVPVVATDTEPARWIVGDRDRFLARPGDADDLRRKIQGAFIMDRVDYGPQGTWESSAELFEQALCRA
jgi:glycosyltransferase involved in cell wall biosynthesis